MSFELKWTVRQMSLELISYFVCFTTLFVVVPIAIDFWELFEYGYEAYGYKNSNVSPKRVAKVLWHLSIYPWIKWLPLTIIGDIFLRRYFYGSSR